MNGENRAAFPIKRALARTALAGVVTLAALIPGVGSVRASERPANSSSAKEGSSTLLIPEGERMIARVSLADVPNSNLRTSYRAFYQDEGASEAGLAEGPIGDADPDQPTDQLGDPQLESRPPSSETQVTELAPHGSVFGENRSAWRFPLPSEAAELSPENPVNVFGRRYRVPVCIWGTRSPHDDPGLENKIALGENRQAPAGQAWYLGIAYGAEALEPGPQGDAVVLYTDDTYTPEGVLKVGNYISARIDRDNFFQWSVTNAENVTYSFGFGFAENGVRKPIPAFRYYIRLFNGDRVVAQTSCAVGNPEEPFQPLIQSWRPKKVGGS